MTKVTINYGQSINGSAPSFYLDSRFLNLIVKDSSIYYSTSQSDALNLSEAELFLIQNAKSLVLDSLDINLNQNASKTSYKPFYKIQSPSQKINVAILNSVLRGQFNYEATTFDSDCFQIDQDSQYKQSPFFSLNNSIVSSANNTFLNKRLSSGSGVFQLSYSNITDLNSSYRYLSSNLSTILSCDQCGTIQIQNPSVIKTKSCKSMAALFSFTNQLGNFTLMNTSITIESAPLLQYLIKLQQPTYRDVSFNISKLSLSDQGDYFETGLLQFNYGNLVSNIFISELNITKKEYFSTLLSAGAYNRFQIESVRVVLINQMKSIKLYEQDQGIINVTAFSRLNISNFNLQCSDIKAERDEQVSGVLRNGSTLNSLYNSIVKAQGTSLGLPYNLCVNTVTNVASCQLYQALIEKSSFQNCYNLDDSAIIKCSNCQYVLIYDSKFNYISRTPNYRGQPSGLFQTDDSTKYLHVLRSQFRNIVTEGATLCEIQQPVGNVTLQNSTLYEIFVTKKNGGILRTVGPYLIAHETNLKYWKSVTKPVFILIMRTEFVNISSAEHGVIVFYVPQYIRQVYIQHSLFQNITTNKSGAVIKQIGKDHYGQTFVNMTVRQVFAYGGAVFDYDHLIGGMTFSQSNIECFQSNSDLLVDPQINRNRFSQLPGPLVKNNKWNYDIYFTSSTVRNCISFGLGGVVQCGVRDIDVTYNFCTYIVNSIFTNNSGYHGGVVGIQQGDYYVSNGTFINNTAYIGGVFSQLTMVSLNSITLSVIINNRAIQQGGFLNIRLDDLKARTKTNIYDSNFTGNYARQGGVLSFENTNIQLYMSRNIFTNNSAVLEGGVLLTTKSSIIFIEDCQFYNNQAFLGGIMHIVNDYVNPTVYTISRMILDCGGKKTNNLISTRNVEAIRILNSTVTNCSLNDNQNLIEIIENQDFSIWRSNFSNIQGSNGNLIFGLKSNINIYYSNFSNNSAQNGGVAFISDRSFIGSLYCNYISNKAIQKGGVVYSSGNASVDFFFSFISQNEADEASVAYIVSAHKDVQIKSSVFIENVSNRTVLRMAQSALQITNMTFKDNIFKKDSYGFEFSQSFAYLQSSLFQNKPQSNFFSDRSFYNGFLRSQFQAEIYIYNCTFHNGYSEKGGAIQLSGGGFMTVTVSSFINNSASKFGGAIYGKDLSYIILQRNAMTNNQAQLTGDEIYIKNSFNYTLLSDLTIKSQIGTQLIYLEKAKATLRSLSLNFADNNQANIKSGAGVHCSECYQLIVNQSTFRNLRGYLGGAIYIQENLLNFQIKEDNRSANSGLFTNIILNSNFINCSAQNGGAIYIQNSQNISIIKSTFSNNSATQLYQGSESLGGAIYYFNNFNSDNSLLTISGNSSFVNNSASNRGGAIFWQNQEPIIFTNDIFQQAHLQKDSDLFNQMFINNSASNYGNILTSGRQQIKFLSEDEYNQYTGINQSQSEEGRRQVYDVNQINQTEILFEKFKSGRQIYKFYVAITDMYGEIIKSDNSSKIRILVDNTFNEGNEYASRFPPVIQGQNIFQAQRGIYTVQDWEFYSAPGLTHSLIIISDDIDITQQSSIDLMAELGVSDLSLRIKIQLNECELGEQFTPSGKCEMCSPGTFTLFKMTEPGICQECPSHAICLGGTQIGPTAGFWRENSLSLTFIQCMRDDSCLGYVNPNFNPLGECSIGYQGVLCADCIRGYMKTENYKCEKCPSQIWLGLKFGFSLFGFLILIVFFTYQTFRSPTIACFLKMLFSHFYLLIPTLVFQLYWDPEVMKFSQVMIKAATFGIYFLNMECILDQDIKLFDWDPMRLFQVKVILTMLLPLAILTLCLLMFGLFQMQEKQRKQSNWFVRAMLTSLFLLYPSITYQMFLCFYYKRLSKVEVLYADFEIDRLSEQHQFIIYYFAAPSLIIWGLGFPFISYLLLKWVRKLKKINQDGLIIEKNVEHLKLLTIELSPRYYYWSITTIGRNFLLLFVIAISSQYGVIIQALFIAIIYLIFLAINVHIQPFREQDYFYLENASIVCVLLTLYFGIYKMADKPQWWIDLNKDSSNGSLALSDKINSFISVLMIGVNLLYYSYWILLLIKRLRVSLLSLAYRRNYLSISRFQNFHSLSRMNSLREEDKHKSFIEEYYHLTNDIKALYFRQQTRIDTEKIQRLKEYLSRANVQEVISKSKEETKQSKLTSSLSKSRVTATRPFEPWTQERLVEVKSKRK